MNIVCSKCKQTAHPPNELYNPIFKRKLAQIISKLTHKDKYGRDYFAGLRVTKRNKATVLPGFY